MVKIYATIKKTPRTSSSNDLGSVEKKLPQPMLDLDPLHSFIFGLFMVRVNVFIRPQNLTKSTLGGKNSNKKSLEPAPIETEFVGTNSLYRTSNRCFFGGEGDVEKTHTKTSS